MTGQKNQAATTGQIAKVLSQTLHDCPVMFCPVVFLVVFLMDFRTGHGCPLLPSGWRRPSSPCLVQVRIGCDEKYVATNRRQHFIRKR